MMPHLVSLLPNKPHTEIEPFYGLTSEYVLGAGSMQGWRPSMEDSFSIVVSLPQDPFTSLLGVFDGHGGRLIADFVSKNIYHYIVTEPAYIEGDVANGLINAFMRMDHYLMKDTVYSKLEAGSTAVVVLIRNNTLYCANIGDSRAVGFVGGEVVPLSIDHKPTLPLERKRILEAGCFVEYDRVNGDLAMSRAFGDFAYKQNRRKSFKEQAVIPLPDVVEHEINRDWEFVVLACDGIWDVMSNEQVCHFVKIRINRNIKPNQICEQLLDECLCKNDPGINIVGTDNMTAVIAVFLNSGAKPYPGIPDPRSSSIKYNYSDKYQ